MARKRYKPEEIVAKLRQVDVLVSQGQGPAASRFFARLPADLRSAMWPQRASDGGVELASRELRSIQIFLCSESMLGLSNRLHE
jgi:hypothetical protein